jgi:hypothetical protein
MSDIKQVNMSVPLPKKERRSRKARLESSVGETVPVNTPTIPVEMNGGTRKAPVMVVSPAFKQKAGSTPLPALSTSSVVGGDPKKSTQAKSVVNIPIVKANIGNPYNKSSNTPSPVKKETSNTDKANLPKPVKINTIKKTPETRKVENKNKKVNIVPAKRPNKTLKKNYTAKKITIHMENSSKVRKTRDNVRRNVANMELKEITKKLRERGLIRETANPPENIQRSMMIDILLFPAPI